MSWTDDANVVHAELNRRIDRAKLELGSGERMQELAALTAVAQTAVFGCVACAQNEPGFGRAVYTGF